MYDVTFTQHIGLFSNTVDVKIKDTISKDSKEETPITHLTTYGPVMSAIMGLFVKFKKVTLDGKDHWVKLSDIEGCAKTITNSITIKEGGEALTKHATLGALFAHALTEKEADKDNQGL